MGFLGFGKKDVDNVATDAVSDGTQTVLHELCAFRFELEAVDWLVGGDLENDRRTFILLLSALSSCRISPGIPENMGHKSLFKPVDATARDALRKHLDNVFGITDESSLWDVLNKTYCSYDEYDTFRTFWAGRPEFDPQTLNKDGRRAFEDSIAFAAKLREVCGANGFLAWDINERIGLCRRAYAADYISEERFWEAADSMAFRAAAYYDNWGEYAISCICGAIYYAYSQLCNRDENETFNAPFIKIQMNLLQALTTPEGIWRKYGWPKYSRVGKKYAISAKDMILMIPDWDGPTGCIATDRITVDGAKVGYMYREGSDFNGDSGWRFTAGDESDEYMDNPDNSGLYDLNTICNHDPEIIAFLHREKGNAFERYDGVLRPIK